MSVNRFSILALDDDEVEKPVLTPKLEEPIKEVRQWNIHIGAPAEVRKWNIDESKFVRTPQKRPFHRGYAFKDDSRPETRPMRGYSFKDDSPPAQDTKKPTTPEPLEEFPKLSDYEGTRTPPYPPSDSPILTFADRIKQAMEQKNLFQLEEEKEQQRLEMYSVIPMKTNLSGPLKFTND
jgi:hypothetical protein